MAVQQSTAGHLAIAGTFASRNCTICCWFCMDTAENMFVFDLGDGGSNHCGAFLSGTNFYMYGGGSAPPSPGVYMTAGRWYFCAITVDSQGVGVMYLGYNGMIGKLRTDPNAPTVTIPSFTGSLWVGDFSNTGFALKGQVRDLKVWAGNCLTPAQLIAEMTPGTPVTTSGLYAYVPLPSTSDYTDHSGNSHGATPTGTWNSSTDTTFVTYSATLSGALNIQCVGDSRTWGANGTPYPTLLAAMRTSDTVNNYGQSGATGSAVLTQTTGSAIPNKSATLRNVLVIWFGVNDLTTAQGGTVVSCTNWIYQICDAVTADPSYAIVLCSEIYATPTSVDATKMSNLRAIQRTLDGPWILADLGASPELQDYANSTYSCFYTDQLHLVTAGYQVVANDINAALVANTVAAEAKLGARSAKCIGKLI